MITRKLGAILRGKATPFQLVAACVLGSLLGFGPPVTQAPGLYVLLVGLLLVVNANLGLTLMVAGVMRLASWLLIPVTYRLGLFLLDGPTSGLAGELVNAPVLAWCGLSYYVVAGGEALGLALGMALGLVVARGVRRFRARMAAASENPSRWHEVAGKPWARFLLWLFFGGKGKKSWEEKLEQKVGNPIRVWGAALVLLVLVPGYLARGSLLEPMARDGMRSGLEDLNGATVDLADLTLDIREGLFGVTGLALADPEDLSVDLFAAQQLSADFAQVDLLRRRVHLGSLVIRDATSGTKRAAPGVLVERPAPEPEPAPAPSPGEYTLEEVLAEVEVWKERLAQAGEWIERLSPEPVDPADESWRARLARQAKEAGWLSLEATHLLDVAPNVLLSELKVEGLTFAGIPGRTFDLSGLNLSSQPWLLDEAPRVELVSRDGTIRFEVDLAPASRGGGDGALRFHWRGLSVDDAIAQLSLEDAPFVGGTIDLELDGGWHDGEIGVLDLPLRVTLRDTTLHLKGIDPTKLEVLELPLGLHGPLEAPRVRFDGSVLVDALEAAGKAELSRRIEGELEELGLPGKLGEELGEELGVELPGELGDQLEKGAKDALGGLLGGKKKKK